MPRTVPRPTLAGLAVLTLLPACATVQPAAAPVAAPPVPPMLSDAERYPPPRMREPPTAPIESPALPAAKTPARSTATVPVSPPSKPAPTPPSTATTAPSPSTAGVTLKPPTTAPPPIPPPTASTAPATPSTAGLTPKPRLAAPPPPPLPTGAAGVEAGRWSVQVGVFAVAQNAETLRSRTETRLTAAALSRSEATVRTVSRDGRTHVVVGDLSDRVSAQRLAAQLRTLLQQDVVLFRW